MKRASHKGTSLIVFCAFLLAIQVCQVNAQQPPKVVYVYDDLRRLVRVVDTTINECAVYDPAGRILTITDPRGITYLTNVYNTAGRVSRQTQVDGGVWTFDYLGPLGGAITGVKVTDPRGNPTTQQFSATGFTAQTVDALGQVTKFQRDDRGQVIASTDPLGRVTRFEYDGAGNATKITDPAGNIRTFEYDAIFNRITKIIDPLGNVTRFAYDSRGNLTRITDPLGNATQIAYNLFGQPISTTDPLGNSTRFDYDSDGNLSTIADPLGNKTKRSYDLVSRLIAQTDPRGRTTSFTYDELNRIRQIVDALNGPTAFTYDGNGNLLTVTDARAKVTRHTYDAMDRLETRTDPLLAGESFGYDAAGNLIRHTDRKTQVNTFTYDPLNRRAGASYADGTTTSSVYDSVGRLVQATDSLGGTILNKYDNLDRLKTQTTDLGSIQYTYDGIGRRKSMSVTGQVPVTYGYDAASRLRQIVQGTQIVDIQYDTLGRRTLLSLPNGVSTEYQYDTASRSTALIYRNALGVLGDLTYQYDKAGNRAGVGGSFARTLLPDPVDFANYDPANRQLQFGNRALSYDLNGNLINDGINLYTWSARNQLTGISGPGLDATFVYDSLGRRHKKAINGSPTEFLYDGVNPVQETSGATVLANILTGRGIDEPFSRTDAQAGTTSHLLSDALGSAIAATELSGTVQTEYSYEPFGRTTATGVLDSNSFQYTGRENDGTGLYYYRERYYNPTLQRFMSEDPLAFTGQSCQAQKRPQVLNLYSYVENNPLIYIDPLGLDKEKKDCLAGYFKCLPNCLIPPGLTTLISESGFAFEYFYTAEAWSYAASKGLTTPLRSSIFRTILRNARAANPVAALTALNYCIYDCLIDEARCEGLL